MLNMSGFSFIILRTFVSVIERVDIINLFGTDIMTLLVDRLFFACIPIYLLYLFFNRFRRGKKTSCFLLNIKNVFLYNLSCFRFVNLFRIRKYVYRFICVIFFILFLFSVFKIFCLGG